MEGSSSLPGGKGLELAGPESSSAEISSERTVKPKHKTTEATDSELSLGVGGRKKKREERESASLNFVFAPHQPPLQKVFQHGGKLSGAKLSFG